jgi:hypothetical protein
MNINCNICGKELGEGARAYVTSHGDINSAELGVTLCDDEPCLTVACEECGHKISDAICEIAAGRSGEKKYAGTHWLVQDVIDTVDWEVEPTEAQAHSFLRINERAIQEAAVRAGNDVLENRLSEMVDFEGLDDNLKPIAEKEVGAERVEG